MPKKPSEFETKEIALTGKLITSVDAASIDTNFQDLQNLRYTDTGLRSVGGMTKVNTTALTDPKIRAGIHFEKVLPAESHLLVQAYNSGETASKVYENTTAIGSAGDFNGTELHTDSTNTDVGTGKFSLAPGGTVAYCNGAESMLWGGNEYRVGGFLNYDPGDSFKYDYGDEVSNSLDDSLNVATMHVSDAGNDSASVLMLHCDGTDASTTFTDSSPTTAHTVTTVADAQLDTAQKKFGTASGLFDGTGDWLTIPDDADFDFSGGTFTIDCWVRVNSLAADIGIYSQAFNGATSDYMWLYIDTNGAVKFSVVDTSSETVAITTPNSEITTGTWYHVALVENGDDWGIFINGVLKGYSSDTNRTEESNAYDTTVFIGATHNGTATTKPFNGWIDEFRISNSARWTSNFEVPVVAYGTDTICNLFVGSTRPLKGIKYYIKTANTATGTSTAYYWNGTAWAAVSSLADGTASGGIPLAQTGSMTFTDTDGSAKVKIIDQLMMYWYKIEITSVDTTTTISTVTVDADFQSIKDVWDGVLRSASRVFEHHGPGAGNEDVDMTLPTGEIDYNASTPGTTHAVININSGTNDYLLLGFPERQSGIVMTIGGIFENTSAAIMTLSYWNGTSWVSVSGLEDGTNVKGRSFGKSGTITWSPPIKSSEFKKEEGNEFRLYYYKIEFNSTLSANVRVDYFAGIPAPEDIKPYKFPVFAQDRLWLCNEVSKDRNSVRCSSRNTTEVWNGDDTETFFFGDEKELTAGTNLYMQFGSSIYDGLILCKEDETYAIIGNNPEDWIQFQVSQTVGCPAPNTMKTINITAQGQLTPNKQVAIWQSNHGIHLFDGRSPILISKDIENYFNQNKTESINSSKIKDSIAFVDEAKQEYHWCFAGGSSTTLDKEFVFDIERQRWFEIDRGTGNYLQIGIEAKDTNGVPYVYGAIDTGHLEQLENGTDFDGTDIISEFQLGDMAIHKGSVGIETILRKIKLVIVAKTTTSNNVVITHYGDTSTTGTDVAGASTFTASPARSGFRVAQVTKSINSKPRTFHSLKFSMTTDDETFGFEPLYVGLLYNIVRWDLN